MPKEVSSVFHFLVGALIFQSPCLCDVCTVMISLVYDDVWIDLLQVQLPSYVDFGKTGAFKELSPLDNDWYYVRCAAVARRVYLRQGLGVGALRRSFGGRSNKKGSACPEHHAKGSGGVIRHALHTLEGLGLVEKLPGGKGRRITPEGQRQLDLVAARVEVQRFHYISDKKSE